MGINIKKLIDKLNIEIIYLPKEKENTEINSNILNKLGLQLTGFYLNFNNEVFQVISSEEKYYLDSLDDISRINSLENLFKKDILGIIYTDDIYPDNQVINLSKKNKVPILKTNYNFHKFNLEYNNFMNMALAPTIRMHGVLLDIYGVGVLITGKSGIGKSETALDLISKGSKLISDDSVIIKYIDDRLIGSSPEITKYFMEIRGVGIIDIQKLYGVGNVMEYKDIDIIVHLESWDEKKEYDRLGIDNEYEEILGKKIVKYVIPVKTGRHTALIIEVATKNYKLKETGYNPAIELNKRIIDKSVCDE